MTSLTSLVLVACGLFGGVARAEDKGFRWNETKRKCLDGAGQEGRNPDVLGQCGIFSKADFSQQDLSRLDLRGSEFDDCKFTSARLDGTDLTGIVAKNTSFERISGSQSLWRFASTDGAIFRDASLFGAGFDGGQHKRGDFRYTDFSHAMLNGSGFAGSYFDNSILTDTTLIGAQLVTSSLNNSWVCGADFSNAQDIRSTWRSVRYDATTRLPFSRQEADKRGMIYGPCQ
ncbi:MAG: pentapeptide repeat-containing protein [Bdellovibrionales bacterium]|nr:pentapeptide repeat-containing protein [Bdellovibrionales bacterium]